MGTDFRLTKGERFMEQILSCDLPKKPKRIE